MSNDNMAVISCIVKEGHRIASGLNLLPKSEPVNETIRKQKPFFTGVIPGIEDVFNGTINLDIAPGEFEILRPDYEVTCEWERGYEETFWFVGGRLEYADRQHEGWIYYPRPGPLKKHQNNAFEFLTHLIDGIKYGERVFLTYPREKIRISPR